MPWICRKHLAWKASILYKSACRSHTDSMLYRSLDATQAIYIATLGLLLMFACDQHRANDGLHPTRLHQDGGVHVPIPNQHVGHRQRQDEGMDGRHLVKVRPSAMQSRRHVDIHHEEEEALEVHDGESAIFTAPGVSPFSCAHDAIRSAGREVHVNTRHCEYRAR